jgi:hypothetical protein
MLGIKLLADMHDTITTAIVALTVRVVFVFAFVFICAVVFGFAFGFAARQWSGRPRCLENWAGKRGGRCGDRSILGKS